MSQTSPTTSAPGAASARRAGLLMVSPAMLLMGLFLIVPFVLAFVPDHCTSMALNPSAPATPEIVVGAPAPSLL